MPTYSYASARARAEKQTGGFESSCINFPKDVPLFKVTKKVHRLDIIPYIVGAGNPFAEEGQLHYERTYFTHRGIGPDGDAILCPAKHDKARCPVCEFERAMRKDPDANDDLRKTLVPKQRQLFHLIDLDEPDKGVQLFDCSYHLFGNAIDAAVQALDEGQAEERFFSPTKGFSLKVNFKEKSFQGWKGWEAETVTFKVRAEQYDDSIFEHTHCLDELFKPRLSYDAIKELLDGSVAGNAPGKKKGPTAEEDEDALNGKTPAAGVRRLPARKPAPSIESEEAEADAEAEATPAPVAKKKPAAPPAEEENWEDEAPPKVKSKAKPAAPTVDADDLGEEDPPAPPARTIVKKKPAAPAVDASDLEDEAETEAPPKVIGKKAAAKAPADDEWPE